MVTNTCYNDACSLTISLFHQQLSHYAAIVIIEMAHRLISQDEIEGLAQRTHESHALLLPEAHLSNPGSTPVGDAEALESLTSLICSISAFVL